MRNGIVPAVEHASAKLTVYLHVTGTRDDGYHLLESEMVSLDYGDTLEFSAGNGLEIVDGPEVPPGDDNLVMRAMRLAEAQAHVRLTKRVQPGGGLGGGSSDAAAVLRWAGVDDVELAATLGADVPFCVRGGRARIGGVGEVVEPLPYELRTYTLLTPPFGVNTAAVYRAFDDGKTTKADWSDVNHLQAASLAVEPRLRAWADVLRSRSGSEPALAGSGSTWFVEGKWEAPSQDVLGGARWTVAQTVEAV